MIERWIIIAGEEAGPVSNKMGGIWNVIDAEAETLACLARKKKIDENLKILVAGPYFPTQGSDWNMGKARVTSLEGYDPLDVDERMSAVLKILKSSGIEVATCQRSICDLPIGYLFFNTTYYDSSITHRGKDKLTLANAIKREAWEMVGLDSMQFERTHYGNEYAHYLYLSYAISEFVRSLASLEEEAIKKFGDEAISEFARAIMPKVRISLHCHEFGVFYAIARLKSLGVPVRTMATLHATVPGRTAGFKSIKKIIQNDHSKEPGTPMGNAVLESMARYADTVTFVGDSTMKEAMLFHNLKGIVIRNGIEVRRDGEIDWEKKRRCLFKIQNFLSNNLHEIFDGERVNPKDILPIFTISRIEIENKGYPQLLDALLLHDHLLKHRTIEQRFAEDLRVICFLIAAHGPKPKEKLPEGFPLNLPPEVLVGEEIRLNSMIKEKGLDLEKLVSGNRFVGAVLYPQWVGREDGGLGMTVDEIMAGCVAGVFPSQYEPFLLTGLEAGREGTPNIVSRACGFSDALKKVKRLVAGLGGFVVVDNIDTSYEELVLDYALAMDYFTWAYIEDTVKYKLLCEESFSLAKHMSWDEPVMEYYNNLVV
jgi:glycosyltransferase involved in cell wall biosynthesis